MISGAVRTALVVACLCGMSALAGAVGAAAISGGETRPALTHNTQWQWYLSSAANRLYAGHYRGSPDLTLGTNALVDPSEWRGREIVLAGVDGNFEFEHDSPVSRSIFTSTGAVQFGAADGHDLTPLVVDGNGAGKALQVWEEGHTPVAAVTPGGGFTIDGVTLVAGIDSAGRVEIDALAGGVRQPLFLGSPF